tara:strand:+ start:319 stop:582 length:264 start_codon:yes stop_codon:yes gene_type:complete
MSKIGNYAVELEELTGAVMALGPFHEDFGIDEMFGCNHCYHMNASNMLHASLCPVIKLREVLTKQKLEVSESKRPFDISLPIDLEVV